MKIKRDLIWLMLFVGILAVSVVIGSVNINEGATSTYDSGAIFAGTINTSDDMEVTDDLRVNNDATINNDFYANGGTVYIDDPSVNGERWITQSTNGGVGEKSVFQIEDETSNTWLFFYENNGNPYASFLVNGTQAFEVNGALNAGTGTDYVCVDTNGLLSSGASCTEFEDVTLSISHSLNKDEFKVLLMEDELYPSDHPTMAGKVYNYFATVVFEDDGQTYEGTIKVPKNMKYEDDILYYLKMKLEIHKGNTLERQEKILPLIGTTYKTTEINTQSIQEREITQQQLN